VKFNLSINLWSLLNVKTKSISKRKPTISFNYFSTELITPPKIKSQNRPILRKKGIQNLNKRNRYAVIKNLNPSKTLKLGLIIKKSRFKSHFRTLNQETSQNQFGLSFK
jgi:hypothetical protein